MGVSFSVLSKSRWCCCRRWVICRWRCWRQCWWERSWWSTSVTLRLVTPMMNVVGTPASPGILSVELSPCCPPCAGTGVWHWLAGQTHQLVTGSDTSWGKWFYVSASDQHLAVSLKVHHRSWISIYNFKFFLGMTAPDRTSVVGGDALVHPPAVRPFWPCVWASTPGAETQSVILWPVGHLVLTAWRGNPVWFGCGHSISSSQVYQQCHRLIEHVGYNCCSPCVVPMSLSSRPTVSNICWQELSSSWDGWQWPQ